MFKLTSEFENLVNKELLRCFKILYENKKLFEKPEKCLDMVNSNKPNKNIDFILPYCNVIFHNKCYAMKKNHGLYTQCQNDKGNSDYCIVCKKASLNTPDDKPPHGDIRERETLKKEKKLVGLLNYGNIMKKMNISKKEAIKKASEYNLIIPEEEFIELIKKRGRPKKEKKQISNVVYDTDDEDVVVRKRGRPKKEKKKEKTEEELINEMAELCC